ncbi:hypothetical protein ACSBR2_032716 [Camellia fascicularis]
MSFLWLEFSQSFQVLSILIATSVYSLVYGYRFWTAIGLPGACFPFVVTCQIVLLGCNVLCHVGVLLLHFLKGGCNGIGAWGLNSVFNAAILLLFLNFYVKMHLWRRKIYCDKSCKMFWMTNGFPVNYSLAMATYVVPDMLIAYITFIISCIS